MGTVKELTLFILAWQSMFRIANAAIAILLKFVSLVLLHLATVVKSEYIASIAKLFPTSFEKARKLVSFSQDPFQQLVCCPKCFAVYNLDECIEKRGSRQFAIECSSCEFPLHPMVSHRGTCKKLLMKLVKIGKKEVLKPIKTYCYKPLINSLTELLSKPDIAEACCEWKNRYSTDNLYSDVYDGNIWKEFMDNGFFSSPHSYGLILNIDWFQPFEHSLYSIGVIYMAVLNLPRHIRYKVENVIICGLIPGPKEPSQNINSFLEPLIVELQQLWKGVEVLLPTGKVILKAALLCVACDSPAMRKTAGFVAHNALKGCFKCTKSFPTALFSEKPDYSGFNRDNWGKRTHVQFRNAAFEYKHSKTAKSRCEVVKAHGVRFTVLLNLPYYDAIRFTIIDPMHNLLLGSAKRFMNLLKKDKIDFHVLQNAVDNFIVPSGIGRIPRKVVSEFANFKAEEWKNWVLIYSLISLKPVIDEIKYNLWVSFVQACSLVCSRAITREAIDVADQLILQYCTCFEEVFGKDNCYPNLHMHCHIKDCLLDHGPASSFWLFGFERLNGVLGNVHTNHQSVELQLFRKFVSKQHVYSMQWPNMELTTPLKSLINSLKPNTDVTHCGGLFRHLVDNSDFDSFIAANNVCRLLPPVKQRSFAPEEISLINELLSSHFGTKFKKTLILHKYSKSMIFNGDVYGSYNSRQKNNSLVIVRLKNTLGILCQCPCFIIDFVQCNVVLLEDTNEIVTTECRFVKVIPLIEHGDQHAYPKPVEIWQKPPDVEDDRTCFFVASSSVQCRCAHYPNINKTDPSLIGVVPCNPYAGVNY